jgi:tRNA-guanine family transglycosylase
MFFLYFTFLFEYRTARFGTALCAKEIGGLLNLKAKKYKGDASLIEEGCECNACKGGYTRGALYWCYSPS